jgi:hypothetical protein|mmetsp:Transcript_32941/g.55107  ORF Transcript_32941/g.55107 Transcript_32941/m.55107 type:complete len:106 (+) Transcript_32941:533-850(+)
MVSGSDYAGQFQNEDPKLKEIRIFLNHNKPIHTKTEKCQKRGASGGGVFAEAPWVYTPKLIPMVSHTMRRGHNARVWGGGAACLQPFQYILSEDEPYNYRASELI